MFSPNISYLGTYPIIFTLGFEFFLQKTYKYSKFVQIQDINDHG